jgi:hypothetical protein
MRFGRFMAFEGLSFATLRTILVRVLRRSAFGALSNSSICLLKKILALRDTA